jgi:ribosome maturation factor RimP
LTFCQTIEKKIESPLITEGYGIVRIEYTSSQKKTLQIMIDRLDGRSVTLDDCTKVSRLVGVILDMEMNMTEPYQLEISSCGLDRPLVKPKDYERFVGSNIVVKSFEMINGAKILKGILKDFKDNAILIQLKDQQTDITIPLASIRSCHLDPVFKF